MPDRATDLPTDGDGPDGKIRPAFEPRPVSIRLPGATWGSGTRSITGDQEFRFSGT
jgi:hypothetical protein